MLDAVDGGWLNQFHACLCSPECTSTPSIAQLVYPSQWSESPCAQLPGVSGKPDPTSNKPFGQHQPPLDVSRAVVPSPGGRSGQFLPKSWQRREGLVPAACRDRSKSVPLHSSWFCGACFPPPGTMTYLATGACGSCSRYQHPELGKNDVPIFINCTVVTKRDCTLFLETPRHGVRKAEGGGTCTHAHTFFFAFHNCPSI